MIGHRPAGEIAQDGCEREAALGLLRHHHLQSRFEHRLGEIELLFSLGGDGDRGNADIGVAAGDCPKDLAHILLLQPGEAGLRAL